MYSRLIERLDRLTRAPRRRYAESVFWTGNGRYRDRIASNLYFELSTPLWVTRGQEPEHLAPFEAALERCTPPERALDLGTGAGATAALLAERFPEAEVIGFDGSRAMLRAAASTFKSPNLRFVKGDLRRLPFGHEYFDLVTMLNTLPEPGELSRVAKPGATVLLANTYFSRWDMAVLGNFEAHGLARRSEGQVGNGMWLLLRARRPERDAAEAAT